MRLALIAVVALLVGAGSASAQVGFDLMRPPMVDRRVEVSDTLPLWVALPQTARVLTSKGLAMRPVKNSAVTLEQARMGVLVGALRNTGRCARNVTVRLQYTDEYWRPIGTPAENDARVSLVEPGGLLPYRFRLAQRADFTDPPSGYILQIFEDDQPVARTLEWETTDTTVDTSPCPPATLDVATTITRSRSTLSGYRVSGELVVDRGGPVRADALTMTALLLDEGGDVLEVLTGVPDVRPKAHVDGIIPNRQAVPFALSTPIPLGKSVKDVVIFTEALPDAQVAPPE